MSDRYDISKLGNVRTVRLDATSTQPMIGTLRFWRSPSAWK